VFQASRQKLDAGRFSEVVEDFRELALGKLSAVKICMDLNAVTGGVGQARVVVSAARHVDAL